MVGGFLGFDQCLSVWSVMCDGTKSPRLVGQSMSGLSGSTVLSVTQNLSFPAFLPLSL